LPAQFERCDITVAPFHHLGGWHGNPKRRTLHTQASRLANEICLKRGRAEFLVLNHWQLWCRRQAQSHANTVSTAALLACRRQRGVVLS
jgi:hypothetical protein